MPTAGIVPPPRLAVKMQHFAHRNAGRFLLDRSRGLCGGGSWGFVRGSKVAAILSVVESCRRLKLSVRNYLAAILPGLADVIIRRLPALTPSAWTTTV